SLPQIALGLVPTFGQRPANRGALMRTIRQCIGRARNAGGAGAAMPGIAALWMAGSGNAEAQDNYPNKPIRMIVGFAAGGPTDILARVLGAGMAKVVGEQVYIENRTGAGGNLATEAIARAEPDGYTAQVMPM